MFNIVKIGFHLTLAHFEPVLSGRLESVLLLSPEYRLPKSKPFHTFLIVEPFYVCFFLSHCRSWLNRRQIDGSLNRTPLGFYDRVWQILERTPNGILVAGNHLPQVSDFPPRRRCLQL